MTTKDKSEQQKLFEEIRHILGSKHQVPSHLTTLELNYILNVLKNNKGNWVVL